MCRAAPAVACVPGGSDPFPAARPAPAAATNPAGSQSARRDASAGPLASGPVAARGPGRTYAEWLSLRPGAEGYA
jgi:hypothetical protein